MQARLPRLAALSVSVSATSLLLWFCACGAQDPDPEGTASADGSISSGPQPDPHETRRLSHMSAHWGPEVEEIPSTRECQSTCSERGDCTWINGECCQCNPRCVFEQDCCEDFADECVPHFHTHKSAVGAEVTPALLVSFWMSALLAFGTGVAAVMMNFTLGLKKDIETSIEPDAGGDMDLDDLGVVDNDGAIDHAEEQDAQWYGNSFLDMSWTHMHFRSAEMEMSWSVATRGAWMEAAARVIILVLLVVIAGQLWMLLESGGHHIGSTAFSVGHMVALVLLLALAVRCAVRPKSKLFWSLLAFFFFYMPALNLPPFWYSCVELGGMYEKASKGKVHGMAMGFKDARAWHADCSLQGLTSMNMQMTWILLLPWIIPRVEHMYVMFIWLVCVFVGWTGISRLVTGESVFDILEIIQRLGMLIVVQMIATNSKFVQELGERKKFFEDLQQTEASRNIFRILGYMMPPHVVTPMLAQPEEPIADLVDHVTILFVSIADFDRLTRSRTPSQLLRLLNDTFSKFDAICARNQITKLETVAEEYVACVGVLPEDIEFNTQRGHSCLLERLLNASTEILACQTREVRFKLGMHSGQIVAGVVGTKLPRYRLFGDTIGTAARMMQTALPGQLYFSEDTYADVDDERDIGVTFRGEVEMKGKGKVSVYTYASEAGAPQLGESAKAPKVTKLPLEKYSFEQALRHMSLCSEDKPKRWILSEREGFSADTEREWFQWHHEDVIWRGAGRRFGRWALMITLCSAIDLYFAMGIKIWVYAHPLYSKRMREPVFIYSRLALVFLQMLWWFCLDSFEWPRTHARTWQSILLASTLASMILLFVGHDALTFSDTDMYRNWMRSRSNGYHAPDDQRVSLLFVLMSYLAMRVHHMLFYPVLALIPTALALIFVQPAYNKFRRLESEEPWLSVLSGTTAFLMVVQTCMIVAMAHGVENLSRSRFKARKTLETTRARTASILATLMPPLVLQELQSLRPGEAMPSHFYRHATIARSDLCGFAALAKNTKPWRVVKYVSELFGTFDSLIDKHNVYKVETVGDAYIAGMAEMPLTPTNSPAAVVLFALDMVRATDIWAKGVDVQVACRCGVACGECIGGIVGDDMQRYQLFGRMLLQLGQVEASSPEGRVQVSATCQLEVDQEVREHPEASVETLTFVERALSELQTSKGEKLTFEAVGGQTYLVESDHPLREL